VGVGLVRQRNRGGKRRKKEEKDDSTPSGTFSDLSEIRFVEISIFRSVTLKTLEPSPLLSFRRAYVVRGRVSGVPRSAMSRAKTFRKRNACHTRFRARRAHERVPDESPRHVGNSQASVHGTNVCSTSAESSSRTRAVDGENGRTGVAKFRTLLAQRVERGAR
jgi:hypothetical protein